jgi:hypothetical protein
VIYLEITNDRYIKGKLVTPGIYSSQRFPDLAFAFAAACAVPGGIDAFAAACAVPGGIDIAHAASRIWMESENGVVTYEKNRNDGSGYPVDMEEFIWVKLSARPLV